MELTLKEHGTDTSITHEALFIHHESASHWKAWELKNKQTPPPPKPPNDIIKVI